MSIERRRHARARPRNWNEIGVGLVAPVLAVALWHAVAQAGLVNPQVLPAPLEVARKAAPEGAWSAGKHGQA